MTRFNLVVEGIIVMGVIAVWGMVYIALNPPSKTDFINGSALYQDLESSR